MSNITIEDNLRLSLLFEMYGSLLTKKQQKYLSDYLDNNLSLTELAEVYNTSRQAVNDLIKRTFKVLVGYEDKMGLLKKFETVKKEIFSCKGLLDDFNSNKGKIKDKLSKILEVL